MKLSRRLLLVGLLTACILPHICAQTDDIGSFFAHTSQLFSRGNDCYANIGNKYELMRIATEYQQAVNSRFSAGQLPQHQKDSLQQEVDKLMADYHYLNSDSVSASLAEAERLFKSCMDYCTTHRDDDNALHNLFVLNQELAQLYYKQGQYVQACNYMQTAFNQASAYYSPGEGLDDLLDIQSQLAICLARTDNFSAAINEIDEVLDYYTDKQSEHYGEALRKKGKILMLREEKQGRTDSKALWLYREYFQLKKADALARFKGMNSEERQQYWMRIRPFVTDCYRLEQADASLLYDVALFSKGLLMQLDSAGGANQSLTATWEQVQQKLKPGNCAIEFVQYEKYGRQQMGALVLGNTGQPKFVHMASPDSVMQFAIMCKGEPVPVQKLLYHVHGASWDDREYRNTLYNDSTGLFRYLWNTPLLKAVGNAHQVWFAPDGYLHRIAIEYMLPKEALFTCRRLSSTRRLLDTTPASHASGRALIIGGVNYTSTSTAATEGNDSLAYEYLHQQGNLQFQYLPASLTEAQDIHACRAQAADTLLLGSEATEERFQQLCHNYPIIHISTHGVFRAAEVPQGTDLKPCMSDNSLSESLLAFAGIQSNLNNNNFNPNHHDGILSAKEISSLNLSKADFVVLSCCETGLGYITSDGIYGIQRGLKNAGAKAIVVTLWDIEENASHFFMTNLHQNLRHGMTIGQAFYQARQAMRDYSEQELVLISKDGASASQQVISDDFSEPSYRDAFLLIDALE